MTHSPNRRDFLTTTAIAGAATMLGTSASAKDSDSFAYEVTRTDAEWRAQLTDGEYNILRENGTEWPESSPYWDDYSEGMFHCVGCDLPLYSSEWRAPLELGWVFFFHAEENAILTGIDKAADYSMGRNPARTLIESHCRRCGSHLGHILVAGGKLVHCINGTSLSRRPVSS